MYDVVGPTWESCHVQSAWIYEPGQQVDYMSIFTAHQIARCCIPFFGKYRGNVATASAHQSMRVI